jgi:hypothetical protein
MICRKFKKYGRGDLDRASFERHASGCVACREALRLDDDLMAQAASLRREGEAPHLWDRIEAGLRKQAVMSGPKRTEKNFLARFLRPFPAAVLLAGMGVLAAGGYLSLKGRHPSSGLLADKALARVERKEAEYREAIEALAAEVRPRLVVADAELAMLYRERLEAIDAQIDQCRRAIETNPANAHIRRSLMAALQDKKVALVEVLNLKDGPAGRS